MIMTMRERFVRRSPRGARRSVCWLRVMTATTALCVIGCGAPTGLRLRQPWCPGPESEMVLTTNRAWWAPEPQIERVLVEFPLPGATTGEAMYLLYLRIPAHLPADEVRERPIRGMLIQTRGKYAGREDLVGGTLTLSGTSQAADARHQLQLELRFEFGTTLTGRILTYRNDALLETFETRGRPGDVAELQHGERLPDRGRGMPGNIP